MRIASDGLEECRRVYSWTTVGRQIMDVYAAIATQAPDAGFSEALPYDPSCRFRAEPHLL